MCGFGFIGGMSFLGAKIVSRLKCAAKLDGHIIDGLTKWQFQDILVNCFCSAEVALNTQIVPYGDRLRSNWAKKASDSDKARQMTMLLRSRRFSVVHLNRTSFAGTSRLENDSASACFA
jgi:hypothetical protein